MRMQTSAALAIAVRGFAALVVAVASAGALAAQSDLLRTPAELTAAAPAVFRARFETSKGPFVVEVHREWAPIGADRFYNLVRNGFYDGTRFFRVRPGFMAQFGLHGDASIQRAWTFTPLRDDPPAQSNLRGFVTFTTENRPQSRFTQVFVNLVDNSYLDKEGFVPFGRVTSGMDVVEKLHAYGRDNEPDQRRILREGNEYLEKEFPLLDYVKKATIEP